MKSRPNKSQILQFMRDDDMSGDPWGTAMSWAFACAEALTYAESDVPDELDFHSSPAGPVIESYADCLVLEYLGYEVCTDRDTGEVLTITEPESIDAERVFEVQHAARCLARYLDWCVAAGLDY